MIVGLTGNIGSGKTYIANIFAQKGIPIYNSDIRAKYLMNNEPKLISEIEGKFGKEAYVNKSLNRAFIGEKIFNNKEHIGWINSKVHPAVEKDFKNWVEQNKAAPFVIKEAAILIESGAYKLCDIIILVKAPLKLRVERVKLRDNLSETQIMQRVSNQMSDEKKINYANYVINNDGTEDVEDIVSKICKELIA